MLSGSHRRIRYSPDSDPVEVAELLAVFLRGERAEKAAAGLDRTFIPLPSVRKTPEPTVALGFDALGDGSDRCFECTGTLISC
ncbi:hypothetical protein Airi02_039200 [Actinoallomurus iriomotensis]|uniref:Uncharacterized protein n=1 Tax=Actinoallomurus iriomotensis TaxID=478107 RepID=A0A9W6S026_9ACTN|nr:hypothetical protein Airi02_039200 [Actinoallomurus iriomotensis]